MLTVFTAIAIGLSGCQSTPLPPIRTAEYVDLDRFMGDWYVQGNIPTFIERNAYNARESYQLDADGTIATTFSYQNKGFDGPTRQYHPRGFVRDTTSNAVWGMRFVWPFKAEYRIIYVNDSYTEAIIGRSKRDYLWIMTRAPNVSEARYAALVTIAVAEGYDAAKIRRVPQQLPQPAQ